MSWVLVSRRFQPSANFKHVIRRQQACLALQQQNVFHVFVADLLQVSLRTKLIPERVEHIDTSHGAKLKATLHRRRGQCLSTPLTFALPESASQPTAPANRQIELSRWPVVQSAAVDSRRSDAG